MMHDHFTVHYFPLPSPIGSYMVKPSFDFTAMGCSGQPIRFLWRVKMDVLQNQNQNFWNDFERSDLLDISEHQALEMRVLPQHFRNS